MMGWSGSNFFVGTFCVFLLFSFLFSPLKGEEEKKRERPLNVLGVTGISKSHSFAVLPVLEGMVARGHNVTYLLPDNEDARSWFPEEKRPKGLHFVFLGNQTFKPIMPDMKLLGWGKTMQFFVEMAKNVSGMMERGAFPLDIPTTELIERQPNDSPIDVMLSSMISLGARRAGNAMGVPVVGYVHAPLLLEITSNNRSHNLRFPSMASGVTQNQLKSEFGKRLWNQAYHLFLGSFFRHILLPTLSEIIERRYGETHPFNEVSDIFVGTWAGKHHMVLGGAPFSPPLPKGSSPHLHVLGVVTKGGEGSVEGELGEWLDDAKEKGAVVLYISMGTIYEFTEETILPLLTSIDSLLSTESPQDIQILWSLRAKQQQRLSSLLSPLLSSHPHSLRLETFTPQSQVLSHPSVKIFLSHCGWGGLSDTMSAGVPVLAYPAMGDQPSNAVGVLQAGGGERLSKDFSDLSVLTLKILEDWEVYSKNIVSLYEELGGYGGLEHAMDLLEGVGRGEEVLEGGEQMEKREMMDEFFFDSQWEVRVVLYVIILLVVGLVLGLVVGVFVCLPWKIGKYIFCGGKRKVE